MSTILIGIIAGLCVAILLSVLFYIDERDKKKQQQTKTKTHKTIKRNKPNQITIKSIYWITEMWQTQTTIKTQQPIMSTTITLKNDFKLVCDSFSLHNNIIKLSIFRDTIDINQIVFISRFLKSDLYIKEYNYILSIDINVIKSIEY